jgi:hypothetical protein
LRRLSPRSDGRGCASNKFGSLASAEWGVGRALPAATDASFEGEPAPLGEIGGLQKMRSRRFDGKKKPGWRRQRRSPSRFGVPPKRLSVIAGTAPAQCLHAGRHLILCTVHKSHVARRVIMHLDSDTTNATRRKQPRSPRALSPRSRQPRRRREWSSLAPAHRQGSNTPSHQLMQDRRQRFAFHDLRSAIRDCSIRSKGIAQ